jgi:hypothetical protein
MIELTHVNNIFGRIIYDDEKEFKLLCNDFTFYNKKKEHTFRVKNGLDSANENFIYPNGAFLLGLKHKIIKQLETRKIPFVDNIGNNVETIDESEWNQFLESLRLDHTPYDYQRDQTKLLLEKKKAIGIAATGSGKSLMFYIMTKWLLKKGKRVLLVVPNVSLVEQMFNDFKSYEVKSEYDFIKFNKTYQKIYAGQDKFTDHPVKISTFQSIFNLGGDGYFKQFQAGFFDECFDGETLITMKDGSKRPIKDVKAYEQVLSYDGTKLTYDTVTEAWKNETPKSRLKFKFADRELIVTPNQMIKSNGKWILAKDLKVGDEVDDVFNLSIRK